MSGQELDFIAELDAAVSNVGSDVVWSKTVGGVKLLISPLTVIAQEKVTEVITKMNGPTIVAESKRVTLSHAVVGIEEFDLRQYRGRAVFPSKGRDGKTVAVTLDRYMYDKIGTWSSQFVDDVFDVYADLMVSFQKANLKDVTFENAKSPIDELVELEARVHELRHQLRMPDLVERTGDEADKADTEPPAAAPEEPAAPAGSEAFDPFKLVEQPAQPQPQPPARPAAPAPSAAERAAEIAREESGLEDAIRRSRESSPAAERPDVLDVPAQRAVVAPPVLDPAPVNRNPRFAGPKR